MINEAINYLGRRGRDQVTGFTGVVSSVSFDLFGCVVMVLTPEVNKNGKLADGHWFDVSRIVLSESEEDRVMDVPDFEPRVEAEPATYGSGAAEKPPLPER